MVLTGSAQIDPAAPPADQSPVYVGKYADGMARIGMTARQFASVYSVAIRLTVSGLRGH